MIDETVVDRTIRAIADPTRRLIIDLLHTNNGLTLFGIYGQLSQNHDIHMSRQAVTKHLNILESAELLTIKRIGRTKHHYLNTAPLKNIGSAWLNTYLHEDEA